MIYRPLCAMVAKDLKVSWRNPLFLAITVLVSLVFVGMYALLVRVSATSPVALAVESEGPATDRFVEIVRTIDSVDGEFFEVVTTDPAEARRRYADGDIGAVLVVPEDFEARVAAGQPVTLPLQVFNINSDATKNFQLRVDRALRRFSAESGPASRLVEVSEDSRFARDMRITEYLGTGLLMFAVIFAAMVNTGTLIAREWEERTAKPVVLSPTGQWPFVAGKWIGAGVQTFVSVVLVLGGLWLLLDYPVLRLGAASWLAILVLYVYGAAFGALLGVGLRRSLPIVPLCVVLGVTHLLLTGYESYLRGFAHSGGVELLWRASGWWPMAGLTDQIRFQVSGLGGAGVDWAAVAWTLLVAAVLTTLAVGRLRRQLVFAQGQ